MSATLYRKYRPQKWAELAGQNHIKVALSFEVEAGQIAHAYLFSGPRGTGKTTVARILAKAVNCLDRQGAEPCGQCEACLAFAEGKTLDIIEIDAASHRGIDAVRENIIENARFSPARLKNKVFIIDEVHMLTTEAFNALLKTLEEPPANVLFILATTELHKVPSTIVSRCQRFDFRRIPFDEVVTRLHQLAEREGVKVDAEVLREIARNADGGLRDAEGLLGKVLTVADGKHVGYDEAMVVLPRSDYAAVSGLVEALLRRDTQAALEVVNGAVESGLEMDDFMTDVIELLRRILLVKIGGLQESVVADLDETRRRQLTDWQILTNVEDLVAMLEMLMAKRRDIRSSHLPQMPLEIAIARICEMGESGVHSASTGFNPPSNSGHDSRPPSSPGSSSGSGPAPRQPSLAPKRNVATSAKSEAVHDSVIASERKNPEVMDKPMISESITDIHTTPTIETTTPPLASGGVQKEKVAETPSVPLVRIKQAWLEFTRLVGEKNHSLPFLLGVSEPLEMKGGLIQVGFNYAFHRDKFNVPKNRDLMERVLAGLLGQAVRLEAVILERKVEMVNNVTAAPVAEVSAPAADEKTPIPVVVGPITGAEGFAAAFGGRVVG
ncbi:MAG: DNA polymerase III subunit gamma/tau [Patescibacteria group bacterium]|nr:DNA polymerase III subunit gamma/tau [Patescibacteria group bacterium]